MNAAERAALIAAQDTDAAPVPAPLPVREQLRHVVDQLADKVDRQVRRDVMAEVVSRALLACCRCHPQAVTPACPMHDPEGELLRPLLALRDGVYPVLVQSSVAGALPAGLQAALTDLADRLGYPWPLPPLPGE